MELEKPVLVVFNSGEPGEERGWEATLSYHPYKDQCVCTDDEVYDASCHCWALNLETDDGLKLQECSKHSGLNEACCDLKNKFRIEQFMKDVESEDFITHWGVFYESGICHDLCYLNVKAAPAPPVEIAPVDEEMREIDLLTQKLKNVGKISQDKVSSSIDAFKQKKETLTKNRLEITRIKIQTDALESALMRAHKNEYYKVLVRAKITADRNRLIAINEAKDLGIADELITSVPEVVKANKALKTVMKDFVAFQMSSGFIDSQCKIQTLKTSASELSQKIQHAELNMKRDIRPLFYEIYKAFQSEVVESERKKFFDALKDFEVWYPPATWLKTYQDHGAELERIKVDVAASTAKESATRLNLNDNCEIPNMVIGVDNSVSELGNKTVFSIYGAAAAAPVLRGAASGRGAPRGRGRGGRY
jgi:hypothetical protein